MEEWLHGFPGIETLHWQYQIPIKLFLAALFGAIIGMEREYRGRGAGLRTHLLVALGAALVMVVSLHFGRMFGEKNPGEWAYRVDPARMAYGVMTGVGFLGAGAIIQSRATIRGLTTGASLWCTAAVGLAAGFGMLITATFTTLLVLFTLVILGKIESIMPSRQTRAITLTMPQNGPLSIDDLKEILQKKDMRISQIDYRCNYQDATEEISFRISVNAEMKSKVFQELKKDIPDMLAIKVR